MLAERVARAPGVTSAVVNFAATLLSFEHAPDQQPGPTIVRRLSGMGYRAIGEHEPAEQQTARTPAEWRSRSPRGRCSSVSSSTWR